MFETIQKAINKNSIESHILAGGGGGVACDKYFKIDSIKFILLIFIILALTACSNSLQYVKKF